MRGHLRGDSSPRLIAVAAIVVISPDSLLLRLADVDPATILACRGITTAVGLTLAHHLVREAGRGLRLHRYSVAALAAGLTLGAQNATFVMSLAETDVANLFVIASTAPLFAVAFSRVALGERVPRRAVVASTVITAALVVIFVDGAGAGSLAGDLAALAFAATCGAFTTALRRAPRQEVPVALAVGSLLSGLVALPLTTDLGEDVGSIAPLVLSGVVLIPAASLLLARASEAMPAVEVSLIMLLEAVLAPVWVWAVLDEVPRPAVVVAGAVMITVVALHAMTAPTPATGHAPVTPVSGGGEGVP